MIRRQPIETKINHERWLVSYADFITLLFAFFVVMYSVSQVNETKYRTLSETLGNAFSSSAKKTNKNRSPDSTEAEVAPLKQIEQQLEQALSGVLATGEVTLNGNQNWVEIVIDANSFFSSGQATPSDEARTVLNKVADIISPFDNAIAVGGHTDDAPINNAQFKNNWELSSARAVTVVNLLAFAGVSPERMSAVGYGEYRPIADNQTPEGRSANRRVVLRVARDRADIPKVIAPNAIPQSEMPATPANPEPVVNPGPAEEQPETVEPVRLKNGGLLFTNDPDRARNNR
ncbi:flagellar motor protein MotB [Saccharophagus degradans]|uniref:flagellar motor protein MotB n=1 Tax=Saccharophagus degradans TaxID=86304 RepID=UPI002478297E|nr:flagellar motor protein MotB [Saccharophagus degradans]WGP00347.1 flagellar motor protein MotB [Saccharophagus degradans]